MAKQSLASTDCDGNGTEVVVVMFPGDRALGLY